MGYVVDASYSDEGELARAWPRFWARTFDTFLYSLLAGLVIGLLFPSFFMAEIFEGRGGAILIGLLILPFVMIIDAVIISKFGSSLGKAIAGLRVADIDHEKLTLETSLRRNMQVYLKGLALGIPLLNLAAYGNAHAAVRDQGLTSWDQATGSRVFATSNNEFRTVAIAVLAIATIAVDRALAQMT
jgi:uncharacterized RDD family membrane protein YckC